MRISAVVVAVTLLATACGGEGTDLTTEPSDNTTSVPPTTVAPPAISPTAPADLAIQLCDNIEIPVPSVIGTLSGAENMPWELNGVLSTYVVEHPDTYGGRWIDREYGGTVVLAFTDEPGPHLEEILGRRPSETDIAAIEPRPPITVDWTVGESGYAVDVVQVTHTETDLRALQDEAVQALFGRDDVAVVGMGASSSLNRTTLDMIRPTPAQLKVIASEFPDRADMFCLRGSLWDESMAPPSVDEPLTVMADGNDDPLVTCGETESFVLSVLDGPPDVDPASDAPLVVALLTSVPVGVPVPQAGWRTLHRDDETALFGHFEDPAGALLHSFENTMAGWSLRGTRGCSLSLALPDGVGLMNVGLDPEHPIDPDSVTLHLLVSQSACSSGASGVENMRPPEVIESATEVRIAIAVLLPEGNQTCQGNPTAPITIELQSPIGDRSLLDGMSVPPELLENWDGF